MWSASYLVSSRYIDMQRHIFFNCAAINRTYSFYEGHRDFIQNRTAGRMIHHCGNKAAVYSNLKLHAHNPLYVTPPRHLGIEEILPDLIICFFTLSLEHDPKIRPPLFSLDNNRVLLMADKGDAHVRVFPSDYQIGAVYARIVNRTHCSAVHTRLLDFPRGWVWDDEHIRGLIASITCSYPIGAVMFLEYGGDGIRFKSRPFTNVPDNGETPELLVLGGQCNSNR